MIKKIHTHKNETTALTLLNSFVNPSLSANVSIVCANLTAIRHPVSAVYKQIAARVVKQNEVCAVASPCSFISRRVKLTSASAVQLVVFPITRFSCPGKPRSQTALACFNDLTRWEFASRPSDEFLVQGCSRDDRPGSKYLIKAMHRVGAFWPYYLRHHSKQIEKQRVLALHSDWLIKTMKIIKMAAQVGLWVGGASGNFL